MVLQEGASRHRRPGRADRRLDHRGPRGRGGHLNAHTASAQDEIPVFLDVGRESIFAVASTPTDEANGTAVILLTGGDYIPSLNRNRLWVRLARSLAARGYHAVRFDYHGVGESTGLVDHWRLATPFGDDLAAVARWVEDRGVRDIVLVGICFGGATALSCVDRIDGLRGIMVIEHPVYEYEVLETLGTAGYLAAIVREQGLRGLLHRARRIPAYLAHLAGTLTAVLTRAVRRMPAEGRHASGDFVAQMKRVVERRVPTMLVYGTEEDQYEDFRRALTGPLGEVLDRAGGLVEVVRIDGPVHELTDQDAQDAVALLVERWVVGLSAAAETTSRPEA